MKVVIGYDGSDPARDAIHELHRADLPRNTRATVVFVADVWPPPLPGRNPPDKSSRAQTAVNWSSILSEPRENA
jgi:hypothetical protein